MAKKYPEVKFVHPGGYKLAPNFGTYWASTPEAFYLMGIAAGKTTKTNKAGYVVALPISFFLANINAFHLGARSVNPKVETRVVFTGHFHGPGQGGHRGERPSGPGGRRAGRDRGLPHHRGSDRGKAGRLLGRLPLPRCLQKFAPKGWISGVAFTWGDLYTRFAKQVMDGTWKSENILGNLGSDFLAIAPFGPAVPGDVAPLVGKAKQEFIGGRNVFAGPIMDNKGAERVKQGEFWSLDNLGKMDWLAEGIIGQAK